MFSGISCLFCVNYGHSVMSELRSDCQAEPAHRGKADTGAEGNEARIALKRLVLWILLQM
jgi:hypothetical protein